MAKTSKANQDGCSMLCEVVSSMWEPAEIYSEQKWQAAGSQWWWWWRAISIASLRESTRRAREQVAPTEHHRGAGDRQQVSLSPAGLLTASTYHMHVV